MAKNPILKIYFLFFAISSVLIFSSLVFAASHPSFEVCNDCNPQVSNVVMMNNDTGAQLTEFNIGTMVRLYAKIEDASGITYAKIFIKDDSGQTLSSFNLYDNGLDMHGDNNTFINSPTTGADDKIFANFWFIPWTLDVSKKYNLIIEAADPFNNIYNSETDIIQNPNNYEIEFDITNICNPDCVLENEQRCASNRIQSCLPDSENCLHWTTTNNCSATETICCGNDPSIICCSANEICSAGSCVCPDIDSDGHSKQLCGGDDCDDNNNQKYPGNTEICDGLDNDCDNTTTDGSGEIAPLNDNQEGVCAGAQKICNGIMGWINDYSSIPNNEYPTETSCDGLDNNCDGETDENCECTDSETQVCGSDIGECSKGTQTCVTGSWGACVGEVCPETEICDNSKDDDCDGETDEGCSDPSDTVKPVVTSFNVSPSTVGTDETITASYTVTDNTALNQVELWRTTDSGGVPNISNWAKINTDTVSGTSASGSFTDSISVAGKYWYGIHAVDQAGNIGHELNQIDIIVESATCPDGVCDVAGGECSTCAADCVCDNLGDTGCVNESQIKSVCCGNAVTDTVAGEVCDVADGFPSNMDLNEKTCALFGYSGGDLSCRWDCKNYDPSSCAEVPFTCGDNECNANPGDNENCLNCPTECCPPGCADTCFSLGFECGTQTLCGIPTDCGGCPCIEDWICTSWSDCVSNTQNRICSDNNNCGTIINKPAESQSCSTTCNDNDNDGFGSPASVTCVYPDLDCNDSDYDIKPGVFDFCGNGVDEDCDGFDNNCSTLNVDIITPTDNAYFKINNWLNFNGSAIGGNAPYIFKWSSDKDGYLGEGEWFNYSIPTTASLGEHIIILKVTDADGVESTDTITININSANTLTANLDFWKYEFINGDWWVWGAYISGGTEPYSINWTSDLMGNISNEQWVNIDSTATPWNIGEHTIQAVVQDAVGDTVTLSTVIKINDVGLEMWPENASNFYFGNNIWFNANVIGAIGPYDYTWTSDKDGLLRDSGDKPESFDLFQSNSLSEGIHNIELEVTYDTNKTISKNIQIQINPIDPSLVDCFNFSDCNDSDPCTNDVCNNPGLMTSSCSNNLKTVCQDNDICCPDGCNSTNDNDCAVTADNDDPAKVLVVYNDRCSKDNNENGINDNKELALYYQQKRNIPEENMLPVYPNVGGSGCNHYYWQVDSYPDFYNDIILTIKNKLSQLGENNVYYFNLIGVPTSITVDTTENTGRSLDQALVTLNNINDATNYPNYWDYCNSSEYCEVYYGSTLTKPRFDHSFKYNGDNMYLVTRVHKMNLIDGALYGEKYIYNEDDYYRGMGYVDTRYDEYTDTYLNDNYPTFSDATSYAKGDRKMAYGKRIFEIEGWDFKWEATGKEIGESGAVFTDGSDAEFVNNAMWYEGWYNYGKYLDVWQWKSGSVACDLNSNSGVKFLQDAFDKGLTAGVGVTGEPYLTGHPEPEVFIHYMLNGYNFAESAILSYPGWKWRDISYGDPLYNPNKIGKTKVKDTIAPSIMQIFHKANTSDTSSSSYITVRLDMNSAVPDVATYKLEYGVDASYGNVLDYDEVYKIEKEFMLDNLAANTTYHYRIIAKDPVGNTSVSSDNIFKTSVDNTVLPDSVSATASVNIGNAPLSVNFNSTFGSAPVSFIWNFADGSTSLDPNPNHIFSKGFYKVVLQAEFSNGLSVNKELLIIVK